MTEVEPAGEAVIDDLKKPEDSEEKMLNEKHRLGRPQRGEPTTRWGAFKSYVKSRFICCIFVVFFILNLPIAVQTFQMFNCHSVSKSYSVLFLAPSQECYGPEHMTFVLAVALPCLILWVVGAPTVCFLLLRRKSYR
eukprot:TRINITY_DN1409_c0_g1_i3.p1 TRINITY_DN1409_c0_g1~~TRINITY_DN1409_c0_g1_i3.p1  ORF type:complete len:154 (-),score=15.58 TRINITY_DN1409_c0_g1_i3:921-1331(-)